MLHELCHIMLRVPGVCNLLEEGEKIELFCNMVAGATMIPRDALITDTVVINQSTK